jgi:hypothetical protein
MLSIVAAVILALMITDTEASVAGNGTIDLTQNGSNGAGIGFLFSDSNSMSSAKTFFSTKTPQCKIGPLDSVYFYLYGCELSSSIVRQMADSVGSGFLFTSDKSITMLSDISQSSLLVANAWDLSLHYLSQDSCNKEASVIGGLKGCVSQNRCATTDKKVVVGCGSMSCTGCDLVNFFTEFTFDVANFEQD